MEPLIDNDDIQIFKYRVRSGWAAVARSDVLLKGQKPGPAQSSWSRPGMENCTGLDFKLAADSDIIKRGLDTKTGQTQSHCL